MRMPASPLRFKKASKSAVTAYSPSVAFMASMKELLELIAKSLVDRPDEVVVTQVEGEQTTVLELRVAPDDLGKVIGKQGRTARSIRTILSSSGMKLRKRGVFEIIE